MTLDIAHKHKDFHKKWANVRQTLTNERYC